MAPQEEHLKFAIEQMSHVLESLSKKLDRNIISQIVMSFLAYLYLMEPDVVASALGSLKEMEIPPELFQIAAPTVLIYLFMSWSYCSHQFIRVRKILEDAHKKYFGFPSADSITNAAINHDAFIPHSAFKYLYQANPSRKAFDRVILSLALLPLILVVSASTSLSLFYATRYLPSNLTILAVPIIGAIYITFYVQFYRKMKDFEWYQGWLLFLALINVVAGGFFITFLYATAP
jgi:hypothetical protein